MCRKKTSELGVKGGAGPARPRGEPQSEAVPLVAGLSRALGFKKQLAGLAGILGPR